MILEHQGNKASLFDFNGKLIGSTVVSYSVYYPRRGWAEERPEDWWNAVCQATKSVLEMVPDAEVSTVAVTGQMMGCLALDKEGKDHLETVSYGLIQEQKLRVNDLFGS